MSDTQPLLNENFERRLVEFCSILRDSGIENTTTETLDAARSLQVTNILDREQFYYALRTTLVKNPLNYPLFEKLFTSFWNWRHIPSEDETYHSLEGEVGGPIDLTVPPTDIGKTNVVYEEKETFTVSIYSPFEIKSRRLFSGLTSEGQEEIRRIIRRLCRRFATQPGRRFVRSRRGLLDFKRIMRNSLSSGQEYPGMLYRKRKLSRARLVFLFDISGSMESYSSTLLKIMYNATKANLHTEIFGFSTGLIRLTEEFSASVEEATRRISVVADIWGSGTRIGHCLKVLRENYSNLVDRRTNLIIVSDGWDLGETDLLRAELEKLRLKCHRIVWLNPLADNPGYEPLTIGMQAALQYVDIFASMSALSNWPSYYKYFGKAISVMS